MTKKIVNALVVSSILMGTMTAFAQTTNTQSATSTPVPPVTDIACIQNAIGTRDTAIIKAADAYHTALVAALNTRKDALKAAWQQTDKKMRKDALRDAWKAFRDASKSARKDLRNARKTAWDMFAKDRKTCHAQNDGIGRGVDED